jgi:hypothetical protein
MFLDDLPHSVLYDICKYLSFNDIINLSKTCKQLFIFGFKFYQRYINEIFQNKKYQICLRPVNGYGLS